MAEAVIQTPANLVEPQPNREGRFQSNPIGHGKSTQPGEDLVRGLG